MARLVIRGGTATREVQLKQGVNSLGRTANNDIPVEDGSVSSSHCQIIVELHATVIRDLGSTNGTFVNRTQVRELRLRSGQTIHLGEVEMVFHEDGPVPAAQVVGALPTAGPAVAQAAPARAIAVAKGPAIAVPPPPVSGDSPVAGGGAQFCRFHPKMAARFLCPQCQHYFCDACVARRSVTGVPHKFCRHCGAECVPVRVQLEQAVERGFFARVPGAFAYPVRGGGVFVVLAGVIIFALLKGGQVLMSFRSVRLFMFGVLLVIFAGGYLFSYLQCILHSTAAEDHEPPDLPGIANFFEDVFAPFVRLLGLAMFCYAPYILLSIWHVLTKEPSLHIPLIAAFALGSIYFPIAFLAVAILDSVVAGNPMVAVASIARVPVEYFFTLAFLAGVFGLRWLVDVALARAFPEGWTTHSMGELVAMVGSMTVMSFLSMYLVIVGVHLLGLIYVTKKDRLGWLERAG